MLRLCSILESLGAFKVLGAQLSLRPMNPEPLGVGPRHQHFLKLLTGFHEAMTRTTSWILVSLHQHFFSLSMERRGWGWGEESYTLKMANGWHSVCVQMSAALGTWPRKYPLGRVARDYGALAGGVRPP